MQASEPAMEEGGTAPIPAALKRFIWDMQSMVELAESEREILVVGRDLMARLLSNDDCLPAAFSAPSPGAGRQFQIYSDGMARFCVVSTILAGGAALSISQPGIWEIMGVIRGAIDRAPSDAQNLRGALRAGAVETAPSESGGAFRLSNAAGDEVSIAIHVYGGEIGNLLRRRIELDGAIDARPLDYDNDESAAPYDIFSIQTKITD
jgi:predicted metal-dependent enzyme (double-stranded beta helix superfamily)